MAFQRGGDQEGLHAQVQHAGDGGGGVVRVQRGEDQVAGQRGLDGDVGGFQVADLADEDDVGVLPQEGTQAAGEGQTDVGVDLALDQAVEVVFDGVFGGEDLHIGRIQRC